MTFHGVGAAGRELANGEKDVWLDTEAFKGILDVLHRYQQVYVTIDDGNSSDLRIIAPALKERNMQASFLVLVRLLDQPGYLSRMDVKELARMGFTVGSHGLSHCDWRKLGDDDLWREVCDSRQMFEQMIGRNVCEASCPFGSYDWRVLRFLKQAGYRRVYTSDRGVAYQQAWLQARNTIYAWDDPGSVECMLSKGSLSPDFIMCRIRTAIKRLR